MKRLAVLVSGRGSNFEAIARNIREGRLEAEIAAVVANNPESPALQTAAAVRTLGLLEILFAQAASRRLFAQRLSAREATGIAMMAAGLALLLAMTG